jgi:hypothetical protein
MELVNVGSNTYEVYQDLNYVDEYLEAASHAGTYRAETDESVKARWAVTATRLLDRQYWKGSKSVSTQDHAFPRTGMGVTGVADDTTPDAILHAYCEIISALADGSDVQTSENQSQKIQTMKAGSASLTYFRGAEGDPKRWPQIIYELLRDYLSAPTSTLDSASSSGTSAETVNDEDLSYNSPL